MCISTTLKDYRLAFQINEKLNISLRKINDLSFLRKAGENPLIYAVYSDMQNEHFKTCLLSNKNPEGRLIPSFKQIDYFFVILNPVPENQKEKTLKEIKGIANVLTAYETDPAKTKTVAVLLDELELHLISQDKQDI